MVKIFSDEQIEKCKNILIKKLRDTDTKANPEWGSSAENLDKELKEKGYFTSYRFAQKYKFPDSKTNAEYELYMKDNYQFYLNVEKDNIIKLRNAPEDSLLAATKKKIEQDIKIKKVQLLKDYEKLELLNPEMKEINVDKKSFKSIYFSMAGVVYNFKPCDINAFLEKESKNSYEEIEFNMGINKETGLNITYILSKDSRKQIRSIIDRKNEQTKIDNFQRFLESRGHFDD